MWLVLSSVAEHVSICLTMQFAICAYSSTLTLLSPVQHGSQLEREVKAWWLGG